MQRLLAERLTSSGYPGFHLEVGSMVPRTLSSEIRKLCYHRAFRTGALALKLPCWNPAGRHARVILPLEGWRPL